jgi:ABC-2 type transport system permease protein
LKIPAFIKVAEREMALIGSSKSNRNLLLIVSVVVFLLLGFIYQKGALREIPVAVFDEDHTTLSRTIIQFIDASPAMKITYSLASEDDLGRFFLQHDERAVFHIPRNLMKDVIKGNASRIHVLTNSNNIVFGNILLREAFMITGTISAGATIQRLQSEGLTEEQALNLALPIRVNSKPLFNPIYNYLYYLLPGLMTVLLQMIMFFVATRAINSELVHGTFDSLVKTAGGNALNIVLGKGLAYFFVGFGLIMFIALTFMLFGIPFKEKELELILLFSYFVLVNIFLGLMLSATLDDEIMSLDIAFFYNSPAFVFSGFTFPLFGMPFFDTLYAQFIPYTHFLSAFFKLYQVGTPYSYIKPELLVLSLFLFTGIFTAWLALRIRIKGDKKEKQLILA